jgi:parallel beta-helix repeat protein
MFASISNRFNTFLLLLLVLMAAAIIAILATRSSAGPLDPPGPPSSTLPLVEPRTPISYLPYVITSPGSYYLTGDLSSTIGGIWIWSDYVELDLNGFSLTGTAGINGINSPGLYNQITVKNGRVHGWQTGISLNGDDNEVDDVVVSSSAADGLLIGDRGVVRSVRAVANTVKGIAAYGSGDRISVFDSEADYNGGDGINATQGASRVERNTALANAGHGINVTNDSVVIGNTLQSNTGDGIYVAGDGNTVNNNLAAGNGSVGIYAATTSHGNRIEDNHAANNTTYGFWIAGSGSTVFRNSARGNPTANYYVAATNDMGPLGKAEVATSPWANIAN